MCRHILLRSLGSYAGKVMDRRAKHSHMHASHLSSSSFICCTYRYESKSFDLLFIFSVALRCHDIMDDESRECMKYETGEICIRLRVPDNGTFVTCRLLSPVIMLPRKDIAYHMYDKCGVDGRVKSDISDLVKFFFALVSPLIFFVFSGMHEHWLAGELYERPRPPPHRY